MYRCLSRVGKAWNIICKVPFVVLVDLLYFEQKRKRIVRRVLEEESEGLLDLLNRFQYMVWVYCV